MDIKNMKSNLITKRITIKPQKTLLPKSDALLRSTASVGNVLLKWMQTV